MPRENLADVGDLLRPWSVQPRWFTQPASPKNFQARFTCDLDGLVAVDLASELAGLATAFEVTHTSSESFLVLFHTGLGIKTILIDEAGEPIIRISQLEHIILKSRGSRAELDRLLRQLRGEAWLDILEPLRQGLLPLEGLRRVG